MKISCCWMYAIGKYGFPPSVEQMLRAIQEMADLGFEYIELEGMGFPNLRDVVANRRQIKQAVERAGVHVVDFAPLLPEVIALDKETQRSAMALFEQGVETAAYFGSPFVWIDSYFPPLELLEGKALTQDITFGLDYRVRIPGGFRWAEFWEHFVQVVARCNEIAKKHGVQLLIEPRVGEVASNSDALLRLLEAVNDRNLGVILDTAHQHAQKELLPLAIEKLGPQIRYVHIADNDGKVNRHLEPGAGNIDWEGVFLALKKQGYDGYYAIDLEKLPQLEEKFLQSRRFLEEWGRRLGL
ncbi:MAG: sugar phosphate isomerase/epimerase [Planctomycetes bacterium]|nr:sugar phosphate isomerase/epimerase [Planctomycetota bacterium]